MALENIPVYSGEELKRLRKLKGWTIQQLADHSGVSAGAIHNFENEKRYPHTNILKKLLDVLGARVII